MQSFKDLKDTKWLLDFNAGTLRRVKALTGHDLTLPHDATGEGVLAEKVTRDTMLLVDLLWTVCQPQAVEAGVSEDQFAERLGGGVLKAARIAFLEEWASFSRSLGLETLAEVIQQAAALQQVISTESTKQLHRLTATMQNKVRTLMQEEGDKVLKELEQLSISNGSGKRSTNSRGSSASTPAPSV